MLDAYTTFTLLVQSLMPDRYEKASFKLTEIEPLEIKSLFDMTYLVNVADSG